MLEHVSFKHDFRRARTHGFRTEMVADSFISEQKLNCEHVDHSKDCRAWNLLFCYGNGRRTFGFQREIMSQACSFCPKQKDATTISVQNRGDRCLALIAN